MNRVTVNALSASWCAAQSRPGYAGTIELTHASAAGMLVAHCENLNEALAEAEQRAAAFPWWARVADYLRLAIDSERRGQAAAS